MKALLPALIIVLVSAFISFFLSFQAGVFILFFAAVAWWVWEHPEGGFLLFVVLAPLLPMLKITQTIGTVTLVKDIIILTLLFRVFLIPLLAKRLPYQRNVFFAPLALLLAWTGFEMLRADSLILGILRARDIALYALLYLAVLYLPHNKKIFQERLKWFSASLLVLLLLSVYQWFWAVDSAVLRFDPVREVWIPRLSSVMAHPSIFGEYLVAAASLFGVVALFTVRGRTRLLFGALGLVTIPFIFLTYSRAVWVGLAAALTAGALAIFWRLLMSHARQWLAWRLGAISLVCAVLVLVVLMRLTPVGVFVRSAFDPTYGSNEERLEFMARLIAPLSNFEALFGKGLGDVLEQNFREVDLETYDIATGAQRVVQLTKNRTLVDNQYLKSFVELGLAGLLIYGWLYWRFLKASFGLVAASDGHYRSIVGIWALAFLSAFVVQGFF